MKREYEKNALTPHTIPHTINVESLRAGWGHSIAATAIAQGLGNESNIFLPDQDQKAGIFNWLALLHTGGQQRDSYGKASPETVQAINESPSRFSSPFLRMLMKMLRPYLKDLEGEAGSDEKFLIKILRKYPIVAVAFFQALIKIYALVVAKDIVDDLSKKEGEKGEGIIITTHGVTLGFREGLNIVLDPGFIFGGCAGGDFRPENLLPMLSPRGISLVPTELLENTLREYYGRDAFNLGTVGQMMSPAEVVEKWGIKNKRENGEENGKKFSRIILVSTSGNAANLDSILKIKEDYLQYQQRKEGNPYRLVIFLGDHPESKGPRIKEILEGEVEVLEITDENELAALARAAGEGDKPLIIRTRDLLLTAKAKLLLERIAHIEAVKPGEATFMNPHTATVNYFLKPAGPNETMNGIWSAVVYGGGIFAPNQTWEDRIRSLLKGNIHFLLSRLRGRELMSFAFGYIHELLALINELQKRENFFDQMDYLFERDIPRKLAIEAYCGARNIILPLRHLFERLKERAPDLGGSSQLLMNLLLYELRKMTEEGVVERIFAEEERKRRRFFRLYLDSIKLN